MRQDKVLIGDAVIQALCKIHQEALTDGVEDIAVIIAEAIENVIELSSINYLSGVSEELLKQYYILNNFQKLNKKQREQFLKTIENPDQNVVYGCFG